MNEREAIAFILQELKEQRRADFDMYFEMRKNTTAQYERFLDRLREIDELDRELKAVTPPPEPGLIIPKSLTADLMKAYHEAEPGKVLPEPRFKGTESELRVDKYEDTGTYKERVSMEDAVETIEQYLKDVNKVVGLGIFKSTRKKS
jgi:hypothetical protein